MVLLFWRLRDYHAHTVFASMVTIMTLVLEESEDISIELLSPILASVKRDNEVCYYESLTTCSLLHSCLLYVRHLFALRKFFLLLGGWERVCLKTVHQS